MPAWAGRWKGGRYYLDESRRPVYFIERSRGGVRRSIRLATLITGLRTIKPRCQIPDSGATLALRV